MAFAKALNLYWSGSGENYLNDTDVGGIQVKSTANPHGGLLVQKETLETAKAQRARWVLVRGDIHYEICGWLFGSEILQMKQYYRTDIRYPAFIIPDHELHDIAEINKVFA